MEWALPEKPLFHKYGRSKDMSNSNDIDENNAGSKSRRKRSVNRPYIIESDPTNEQDRLTIEEQRRMNLNLPSEERVLWNYVKDIAHNGLKGLNIFILILVAMAVLKISRFGVE